MPPGLKITKGGYFPFDHLFLDTDHRGLWIDISFVSAFGHSKPLIAKPKARRLHCRDPRLVENFNKKLKALLMKHNLPERFKTLLKEISYPISPEHQALFNMLNSIRHSCVEQAEKSCRKLKMGQVAFSPTVQAARINIYAWTLLLRRSSGHKVSSRLITRVLKKAKVPTTSRGHSEQDCRAKLKEAHRSYYSLRKSAPGLRATYLDSVAEAWAIKGNQPKEKIIKTLKHREQIRASHKKIKFLRGKLARNTITMVTLMDDNLNLTDLTSKADIEKAILAENASKFQQSFHSPFYTAPLSNDFGYKALTPAANQVLLGVYNPPPNRDKTLKCYIEQLAFPPNWQHQQRQPLQHYSISLEEHKQFWRNAREETACFPCALSFAKMKAGAQDDIISEVDCIAAQIPLKGGFAPDAWQYATDVMIPKKSGVTLLSGLRTIVLFPVDCNYVFKFIGRQMMRQAEELGALAPEQYGSRKHHKAIDLATCKNPY
jgi:hypothetical protein